MSILFTSFESTLAQFFETISNKSLSTEQLIDTWNTLQRTGKVIQIAEPSKESPTKTVEKAVDPVKTGDRCIFKITRGEKMGEQCTARAKKDHHYCIKHYKPKENEKDTPQPTVSATDSVKEKRVVLNENPKEIPAPSSLRMELEFKRIQDTAPLVAHENNWLVGDSNVVVNKEKLIIGYMKDKKLVSESNKETDSVAKQYKFSYASSVSLKIKP